MYPFKDYKGAESSPGMGDAGAAKQSGVKGFEEIGGGVNVIYVP